MGRNVVKVAKLRTYNTFKTEFKTEQCLLSSLSKPERSQLAQLRCGVLPLRVETGRYVGLALNERLCTVCQNRVVEDEIHFILQCPTYADLRKRILFNDQTVLETLASFNPLEQLSFLMKHHHRQVARFIAKCMERRAGVLYR